MVEYVFSPSGMSGVFFEFYKMCYNAVWIFVLASFCLAAVVGGGWWCESSLF